MVNISIVVIADIFQIQTRSDKIDRFKVSKGKRCRGSHRDATVPTATPFMAVVVGVTASDQAARHFRQDGSGERDRSCSYRLTAGRENFGADRLIAIRRFRWRGKTDCLRLPATVSGTTKLLARGMNSPGILPRNRRRFTGNTLAVVQDNLRSSIECIRVEFEVALSWCTGEYRTSLAFAQRFGMKALDYCYHAAGKGRGHPVS